LQPHGFPSADAAADSCGLSRDTDWTESTDWTEPLVIRAQNGGVFGSLGRLRFDYADDTGDEVRIRGQLMTHLTRQFGLDAEAQWFDASHNSDFDESFWTGDANLVYRLGDTKSMLLRFGLGTNYVLREGDADFGYNLTYGADVFVKRPWLLSGEMDWGAIDGDKLLHWRVTAGAVVGSFEIYAGYDKVDLDRFTSDGPIAGVGWIF
jgi:hypothetical protein